MKSKIVSFKELTTDNPTFCLSVLRVFDECHKCPNLKRAQTHNRVDALDCKPHINAKYFELLAQKRKVLKELRQVEADMDDL